MPLITEFGRQRQINFCEFEASLVSIVRSKTAKAVQKNPDLNPPNKIT